VPTDSYIPRQVVEATSGRAVTVFDQAPALRGRFDNLYDNQPDLNTEFNGVDFTFNKRLSNRWMVMGGASIGKNVGDIYGTQDLNDPNLTFRRGRIGNDMPFSFKLFGLYQLPYKISLSGTFQSFRGFPELTTVLVTSATVPLTRVTQSIAVQERATTRLPDVNMMDLSLRRPIQVGKYMVEPVLDVFNMTNGSAIRARSTVLGPLYFRASDVQRGRLVKFGLNVRF
jgi:hypothetical protein